MNMTEQETLKLFFEQKKKLDEQTADDFAVINSEEELKDALFYVASQFQKMSHSIERVYIHYMMDIEGILNETDYFKDGLKEFQKCEQRIYEYQQNLAKVITSIRIFIQAHKNIDPTAQMFEVIEEWTEKVETIVSKYEKLKKQSPIPWPSLFSLQDQYNENIKKINELLQIVCPGQSIRYAEGK